MDSQFWIKAWIEGRTGFHQKNYNQELIKYFPTEKGKSVLVPLCGKTRDMLWLHDQGLSVDGYELYEDAVKEFFTDNGMPLPQRDVRKDFVQYKHQNITLYCGDFFKLHANESYDFIYDRAALVALPEEMRKSYAQTLKESLNLKGQMLLITYEYDQAVMSGPPFSVTTNEVHKLYDDMFEIRLLESSKQLRDSSRLSTIESLEQKVYLLTKIR